MDTDKAAAHPLGVPESSFTGNAVQRLHAVLNAMLCLLGGAVRWRVPSPDEIRHMRTLPRKCHVNCTEYARMDPEHLSTVVRGRWRRAEMAWVFHSVIERGGRMFCITPCPQVGDERTLLFVPDGASTSAATAPAG